MKEKVISILLIVVFVILLILVNNMLDNNDTKENNLEKIEENVSYENNINEEVISSNYENKITNTLENNIENDTEKSADQDEGKVIKVTEATFEAEVLNSDKKVLIDFYADWCNPCKVLSPIVEEVANENPDLKVVKINVDENENLAYEYRAFSIPTLVVIEDGKEVNRAVGAIPKKNILELVK